MINIIKEFQIKNIDYLACNTLNFPAWTNYYQLLILNTGVIVGASNNETGNIKYGGDWLMESTGQDIELIYFTKSIEYYQYLLDTLGWVTTGVSNPFAITIDSTNNMYVINNGNSTITKIVIATKTITPSWATGFNFPHGIVCDSINGYLYVANNSGPGNISKVIISNPPVVELAWVPLENDIQGITIDSTSTNLYVANTRGNSISKIVIATRAVERLWATGLNGAQQIAIDTTNTFMYVTNSRNNTISKINMSGGAAAPFITTGLSNPTGISIDLTNTNLYVANSGTGVNTITKIDISTKVQSVFVQTSFGLSDPNGIVNDLNNRFMYVASAGNSTISQISFPTYPCFKSDTKILTDKGYIPIQDLRKGDMVKTLLHGYKPIDMIGKRDINHQAISERIKDQLYQCSHSEVFEPLVITGCHSILVEEFTCNEQREKTSEVLGDIYITDDKYRLPACLDERASVYEIPSNYTIYHLALENDDYYMNYGIYANGLLVETCSKRYLKELSNMDLIE
jgi:DNA-binding beta-propeller fold protein YncE